MNYTEHYLLTAYNRHTRLCICLVSSGTTKAWKARPVILPRYSSPFSISFYTTSTVVCLLSYPDFQDFSTPNSLTVCDTGRYKSLPPNTPLQSSFARNNLISNNAILTVYVAMKPTVMHCIALSAFWSVFNPLNVKLNPICYLLALLGAHHFLHVSRITVKLLTLRLLMSYIYGAPILDVSRSHTTTHHSR